MNALPPTKTSLITAAMRAGDWPGAIRIAARLPQLGQHRTAILDAHNAYVRPTWAKSLGKDPEALKTVGIEALKDRFPFWAEVQSA